MTEKDNGGPAFPTVAGQTVYSNGMSLRDYFAGQALRAGIISGDWDTSMKWRAECAYRIADAMLAARSRK